MASCIPKSAAEEFDTDPYLTAQDRQCTPYNPPFQGSVSIAGQSNTLRPGPIPPSKPRALPWEATLTIRGLEDYPIQTIQYNQMDSTDGTFYFNPFTPTSLMSICVWTATPLVLWIFSHDPPKSLYVTAENSTWEGVASNLSIVS